MESLRSTSIESKKASIVALSARSFKLLRTICRSSIFCSTPSPFESISWSSLLICSFEPLAIRDFRASPSMRGKFDTIAAEAACSAALDSAILPSASSESSAAERRGSPSPSAASCAALRCVREAPVARADTEKDARRSVFFAVCERVFGAIPTSASAPLRDRQGRARF